MERLFSRALVECIRDARTPNPDEIARLSARIDDEAFPDGDGTRVAPVLARVAMVGDVARSGGPGEAEPLRFETIGKR